MKGTKLDKNLRIPAKLRKKKKKKKGNKTSSQANPIQISLYFCVLCYIKFLL